MTLSLLGDAIVAALLVATIAYAAVLNRRLAVLRGDREKFEALIHQLTLSTQRAEAGIAGLKVVTEEMGKSLERKVEHAKNLRDDLAYMLERGGGIADRLEGTIRARRDDPKVDLSDRKREPRLKVDPAPRGADEPARNLGPSRAERELLRAIAGR